MVIGASCVGGVAYSRFVEPKWLSVGRHQVQLSKNRGRSPLLVLQLSDLHASPVVSLKFIERAIRLGLEQKPDLILLTGDFITYGYERVDGYPAILSLLAKRAPTFACLGNHDGGAWAARRGGHLDTKFVRGLLASSNISLLHNSSQTVSLRDWTLNVVGLGDSWAGEMTPEAAFAGQSPKSSDATLLLAHNPDAKDALRSYDWNLLLCGHTHGGQLRLPFVGAPFAPVRDKRFVEGLHHWNERWIHVTRGVGNLYGLRINCRPEISLLTLI